MAIGAAIIGGLLIAGTIIGFFYGLWTLRKRETFPKSESRLGESPSDAAARGNQGIP
jgi:hypothetical protein